jgi:hypothetical protein
MKFLYDVKSFCSSSRSQLLVEMIIQENDCDPSQGAISELVRCAALSLKVAADLASVKPEMLIK